VSIGLYSAYRSVEYQRALYARAVERDPGQRSSAAPGRSEHHLGTAADVTTPGVPPLRAAIAESPAGRWLERRAAEFGIVATYSRERHAARGAAHEPWHLRWVGGETDDDSGW
jgi:D-alanyl-D-alanine carboxypeptidase